MLREYVDANRDVQLLPFLPEHLDMIALREGQEHVLRYRHIIAMQASCGMAMTLVVNDAVVAIGGITSALPHTGTCWMVCGELTERYRYLVLRVALQYLNFMRLFYHRLEMDVLSGFEKGKRFAEALGFQCESIKKKADARGNDYHVYVKVM